jgi:uncharacterized membrane protein YfcA
MIWLCGGGFFSAWVSGITGMAGGTLLLSILSLFYAPQTTIALHGLLQVFANLSRVILFIKSVSWKHVGFFVLLSLPGAYLGANVSTYFSPQLLKALLGILILYVAFKPKNKKGETVSSAITFIPLGFASGFLGMIIGVTGPLLAPFFLRAGITKERFVATKALCQFVVQLIKVAIFATLLQFDYTQFQSELLFMILAIFIGTIVAKITLPYVSEKIFIRVLKGLLIILGTKLILSSFF